MKIEPDVIKKAHAERVAWLRSQGAAGVRELACWNEAERVGFVYGKMTTCTKQIVRAVLKASKP